MKLSIVMIIYNTEQHYVRAALDSIAASTLRDVEICMVDDGSKVDYFDLAREFGARLYKQPNSGMVAARMAGINMATGDYIAFVDSDDTVSVNYHQPMLETAEKTGADIVINDWAFRTERTRYACPRDSVISGEIALEGDAILRALMEQGGREQSYFVAWNKIFRASMLKAVREQLMSGKYGRENICYGEDVLLNFYTYRAAKKLCNVHTGYYFYRIHSAQSVNVTSEERLRGQIKSIGMVFGQIMDELQAHPNKEVLLAGLKNWMALMSRAHYSHASANRFEALHPEIMETYDVKELKKSTWHDSSVYYKARLLPVNFEEIDQALRPLFDSDTPIGVRYDKGDRYIRETVKYLQETGHAIGYDRHAEHVIPKGKIRVQDRIIHNDLVYTLGVLLFKKGSKLRALLKRIL